MRVAGSLRTMRDWTRIFDQYPGEEAYIGLSYQDALDLAKTGNYDKIRTINSENDDLRVTMDMDRHRLNLLLSKNVVVKAARF